MKPELIIALYGAVVATAVAIWNAYTWRRTNRLKLTGYTSADMELDLHTAMRSGADPDAKYIVLTVGNPSPVPCTINTVWILAYAGWWSYLRQKHTNSIHVMRPASEHFGCPVPYKLERGGEFRAIALQTPELEKLTRTLRVYMAISHSMSGRPFRVRVRPMAARAPVLLKTQSKAA